MALRPGTLVLADSHLRGDADPRQAEMVRFLERQRSPERTLVLLGDFLEFMAGDNRVAARAYAPVLRALSGWRRVHYFEGNHDFDLDRRTPGFEALTLHPRTAELELSGLRCLLTHGDRSSPRDFGTRFLRALLQSRGLRFARDRVLPDGLIFRFALRFATLSRQRTWPGREDETRATLDRAAALLAGAEVQAVVFAHTHQPVAERTDRGWLLNPGAAQPGGTYLEIVDGQPGLRRFPDGDPPD